MDRRPQLPRTHLPGERRQHAPGGHALSGTGTAGRRAPALPLPLALRAAGAHRRVLAQCGSGQGGQGHGAVHPGRRAHRERRPEGDHAAFGLHRASGFPSGGEAEDPAAAGAGGAVFRWGRNRGLRDVALRTRSGLGHGKPATGRRGGGGGYLGRHRRQHPATGSGGRRGHPACALRCRQVRPGGARRAAPGAVSGLWTGCRHRG